MKNEANLVPETVMSSMQQFADFIHTAAKSELENFSVENDRLDTFLQNRMAIRYPTVWLVVEMALLLSHGQATVERGFHKQSTHITQKKQQKKVKQDKKRKAETDAVRELEDKRKRLKTDISSLLSKSKELYEKCENTGNLTLLHKGVLFVERQMTTRSS